MVVEDGFVPAEKADLEDLEIVIGLFIGGMTRTYPVRPVIPPPPTTVFYH